jgi:uncharacterized protein YdeI (YjbR/CyaY-like superfamily)
VPDQVPDLPVEEFASARAWERWLRSNHKTAPGLWLKIAKKGSGVVTVDITEAVEVALCYGWIDGLRHAHDDTYFRQRFTPRKPRSKWSRINRERAEALIAAGRMRPAGQAEVDAAKADGRWEMAYAGSRTMEVPDDLGKALRRNAKARRAFEALDSRNRYAILYRIHDAKRPETRARRIEQFVTMLEEGRTLH